jgi:hypothetical protein
MKENLSLLKKIALKAGFSWIKIIVLGILISIIGVITSLILYSNHENPSGSNSLTTLFTKQYLTTILFVSSCVMLVFTVVFANKFALHTTISLVYKEKLQNFIEPKIDTYIANISKKQPGWLDKVTSASGVKLKLLGEMRFDKNISTLNKKVLQFGFKQINMDDVDFSQPDINYPAIISYKINQKIAELATPSMKLFWILSLLLTIILTAAVIKA